MDAAEYDRLIADARKLGTEHGYGVATWVFDGNTPQATYVQFEKWIDDGDPEMWTYYREPLSGEFADDMTPDRLFVELGFAQMDHTDGPEIGSGLCDAYEDAHRIAWETEVERAVRVQVDS